MEYLLGAAVSLPEPRSRPIVVVNVALSVDRVGMVIPNESERRDPKGSLAGKICRSVDHRSVVVSSSNPLSTLPDPGRSSTLDELIECLRSLKTWAGNPSFGTITARVNAGRPASELVGKTTVADCFRVGRRRLDNELIDAVVRVLHSDVGYVSQWRQALRVVTGETRAAAQVRVRDTLPQDLAGFTGREFELRQIRKAVRAAAPVGGKMVITALEGMAGAGKTQLAIHVAHGLVRDESFDRVLFVNLRGFHPDASQPPADPGAVLDGFLRLLGVPGQQIPNRLDDRVALYRRRMAGGRSLIVLDNAADEEQVRPLLPGTSDCVILVTSRRSLTGLQGAVQVEVDVFTPVESLKFLAGSAAAVPVGDDPHAASRIAVACGHLPLALALVAGQMRSRAGWTLTDYADWLDERRRDRRLEFGVGLALEGSYRNIPGEERDMLRALALHPGQDVDLWAAAALSGTSLDVAKARLRELSSCHLVEFVGAGRYMLHDLVRAYAIARAVDEDRRADRRGAMVRLLDYYLATAASAANLLDPTVPNGRTWIPVSPVPLPELRDPIVWLDAERANLVAVALHAADHDRPGHTVSFSAVLDSYFNIRGHQLEALTVHGRAVQAAQHTGDLSGQANARHHFAGTELNLGRYKAAVDNLEQARELFRQAGDASGQADVLNTLGIAEMRLGRYNDAAKHLTEALKFHRHGSSGVLEIKVLNNLGCVKADLGLDEEAALHYREALHLAREQGDRMGEAIMLCNLGGSEARMKRFRQAEEHLNQALNLARMLGNSVFEATAIDNFGLLHTRLGDFDRAAAFHREAVTLFRQLDHRYGQSLAHNGLGEAAAAAGRLDEAIVEHTNAHALASELDAIDLEQQARAQAGLGAAHRAFGNLDKSRHHYQRARDLWTAMNSSKAEQIDAVTASMAR